jgi:hypothetical protein
LAWFAAENNDAAHTKTTIIFWKQENLAVAHLRAATRTKWTEGQGREDRGELAVGKEALPQFGAAPPRFSLGI